METALAEVYDALPDATRMLIEYKFFEPAFYHTDLPDWGTAYLMATKLGEKAQVLIDLGHHPQSTNIEFIVAYLIDEGKLGGFHFNCRKYADDDLNGGFYQSTGTLPDLYRIGRRRTRSGHGNRHRLYD